MKRSSPGRIHISILTQLLVVLFLLCAPLFIALTPVRAALTKTPGGQVPQAGQSGGSFPQTCSGGIQTALGCIPYKTDGFSQALLTFLAGTAGAISLVIMLVATIQIMTGGDNAETVKKGKELFTSAVTGLLFIIFSVTLLKIIAGDIIKLPGF